MFKKRIFSFIVIVFSIVSMLITSVSAAPTTIKVGAPMLDKLEQAEVEQLIDELVKVRLKQTSIGEFGDAAKKSELKIEDKKLMDKLANKGVRPLKKEEFDILNKSSVSSIDTKGQIVKTATASPPTWGPYPYVDMLTYGQKTIVVNGKSYTIWINYAIPKDGGGPPLAKNFAAVKMINEPFEMYKFQTKIFNIYLQKVAGLIPWVSWTPYELFWPEGQAYTSFNTYDLTVSYISRMKYVWQYTASVDLWQLKASSNNVQTYEQHLTRGVKSGQIVAMSREKYNTVYASSYNDIETLAVTTYGYFTNPVDTIVYKNATGGTALSFFPYYASYAPDLAP